MRKSGFTEERAGRGDSEARRDDQRRGFVPRVTAGTELLPGCVGEPSKPSLPIVLIVKFLPEPPNEPSLRPGNGFPGHGRRRFLAGHLSGGPLDQCDESLIELGRRLAYGRARE